MTVRSYDVVAIGSCYVDINASNYPFDHTGIPAETELIGGAYETVAGGSAVNFCRILQQLGRNSAFIGMAGTDPNGDTLAQLLGQSGIAPALIQQDGLCTNVSYNLTSPDGQHIMLVAGTANAALNPARVVPKLEEMMFRTKMLYMGGCFKLTAFKPAFERIADLARQHGTLLVVDHGRIPAGTDGTMLAAVKALVLRAQYYLPSRQEFCELWSVTDIREGLRNLHEQAPDLVVVVKDGTNGAFCLVNGAVHHIDGVKVGQVINTTGAGDTFNAALIAALHQGASLATAAGYGCQVAAAKISGQPLPSPVQ